MTVYFFSKRELQCLSGAGNGPSIPSKVRRFVLSATSLTVALAIAGCASVGSGARPAEEIVLERAQARWNALLAGDWAAAYGYMTPAYKAIVSEQRYGNQFGGPVKWDGATAKNAKCEESRCIVGVDVRFRMLLPGHSNNPMSTYVEEVWLLEDGQWYRFEPQSTDMRRG